MFPEKERIESLLEDALKELDLLQMMSSDIRRPYDFVSNLSGLTAFRACGMSLQYITEIFVKIRNLCGKEFFNPYSSINWNAVFGMRNIFSTSTGILTTRATVEPVPEKISSLQYTEKVPS